MKNVMDLLSIILMTLGLGQALQGLALLLFGGTQRNFPQIFPAGQPYRIGLPFLEREIILKQNLVWSFLIALLGVILIGAIFKYTRTGLAMRATSEDHELARSMGLNVPRIFGLSWAIAGVIATAGGVLLAMSVGASLNLSTVVLVAFPVILLGGLDHVCQFAAQFLEIAFGGATK